MNLVSLMMASTKQFANTTPYCQAGSAQPQMAQLQTAPGAATCDLCAIDAVF